MLFRAITILGLAVAMPAASVDPPKVLPLSFAAEAFLEQFNSGSSRTRLVGVFSPTCAHCLQTCADVQEMLERHPQADLDVHLFWAPLQAGDNLGAALHAAQYLPDSRVRHHWDIWKFASRSYSPLLRIPVEDAWGLLLLYPPGDHWGESVPAPAFWMQSRKLRVGTPYTKRLFERRMQPWLEP